MAVKRHRRPNRKVRQVSSDIIIPFSVPIISRNEDLFSFTFSKGGMVSAINMQVRVVLEGLLPVICVILEYRNAITTLHFDVSQGNNVFNIDRFVHKDEVLRLDFEQVDSIYENVEGISGSIEMKA